MIRVRPVLLVASRELRERVRGWTFRLSTIAVIVLAAGGILASEVVPGLIEDDSTVGVVTSASIPGIEDVLRESARELDEPTEVASYPDRAAAETALRAGELDAYLVDGELFFETDEEASVTAVVNRALYVARLPGVLEQLQLTPEEVQPLIAPPGVTVRSLDGPDAAEDEDERRGVAALAAVGLYLVLVMYGNWMLTGVVEEKSSRVVEVLLGLLRPHELLAGKTLGILATAAIQIVAAIAGAVAGLVMTGDAALPDLAADVTIVTAVFFVLGVLLYGLLYATFGATVSRQTDAQSAAMPVTLLLIVPYLLTLTVVPADPDGLLSSALGLFPLTSPLVMPSLVALGAASALEVALALVLIVPALAFIAWLGGRAYAGAILTNRRTTFRELVGLQSLRGLISR